jgi:hypothetical protein
MYHDTFLQACIPNIIECVEASVEIEELIVHDIESIFIRSSQFLLWYTRRASNGIGREMIHCPNVPCKNFIIIIHKYVLHGKKRLDKKDKKR